jgi:fructoselysine-6-P-deglycase FrlB-like protein
MDYRHGPIAIAAPGRVVWAFGEMPAGLAEEVARTGADWIVNELDPQAILVLAQRVAVARGEQRGLDPDRPRHLSRSVVLP